MFPAHLWRPGPLRFAILVGGLWLFGTGEAMIVAADLGNSPWTVLAEGTAENTPLEIGGATWRSRFWCCARGCRFASRRGWGR